MPEAPEASDGRRAAGGDPDAVAELFESARPRLRALAYRMLGTVADAEDAVQETYLRWHQADRRQIREPSGWLVTTCARQCIDRLRRAKTERAAYVGPWLPEPVITEPEDPVQLGQRLSTALLLVLERLSASERAAWLLHDAFDLDHAELAKTLGKSEPACRQLVSRARRRIAEARPRFVADRRQAEDLTRRFLAACRAGGPGEIEKLLAPEAQLWSDGGGKVAAARKVIVGARQCSKLLAGIQKYQPPDLEVVPAWLCGSPGVIGLSGSTPDFALSLEIGDEGIIGVYIVRNPDKLRHLGV